MGRHHACGAAVLLNVFRCQLTYLRQAETNAEAWFNIALRPRKPEGSLGRTAQDGHLDSHTAPELWSRLPPPIFLSGNMYRSWQTTHVQFPIYPTWEGHALQTAMALQNKSRCGAKKMQCGYQFHIFQK